MRLLLFGVGIGLLAAGGPVAADEKAKVPDALKGTWKVTFGAKPGKFLTNSAGAGTFAIGAGTAEWTEVEDYIKAGKGTIKVDPAAKPPTLELKTGDKVYRGIYRFRPKGKDKDSAETDPNAVELLLSPPGGEVPKAFEAGPFLPKGFEGILLGLQRKQ